MLPSKPGGLSSYQRMLAQALVNKGHTVHFVAITDNESPHSAEQSIDGIPATLVCGKILGLLQGRLGKSMCSRSWMHPILERLLTYSCRNSLKTILALEPKVIHYIGTGWSLLGFPLRDCARRCDAIFSALPATHPHSWGDDIVDLRLYKSSDTVICLSEFERSHLNRLGVDNNSLKVSPLPPICSPCGNGGTLRTSLSLLKNPTVLFLGRRDLGKGYPALLEAWPLVIEKVPNAVLLVAGPGDVMESKKALIPSDNIRDIGVPDEDLKADAFDACDVFCLPSAHESFGIVYVEAWSYGKPVICGTAPASRELVEHNRTGLHASQNAEELSRALIDLLSNPTKARAMGEAGLLNQKKRYTSETMLDSHLQAWGLRKPIR